ncbi:hypothetical protein ASD65_12280 [Microbacterium sp. Root61]|uniref:hypothetical protein n=1 Tax=Microbacterium sp. Root61 TaxID=1736570 RepID=UPI0006F43FB8|nr:hypothetical protein [Microbacterium sp. Root61]KRA25114.1 hypothetical protein ASD65_12280 [Microbacterium sp. Root61]
MQPLFDFLGQYWWLVFPVMGVVGSVGGAWERNARRRHTRRLEVLHAKAELKAAANGTALAAASATGAIPVAAAAAPAPQGTQLERLFASHDAVTARWLEYELDVAKLIAFPAMSDGRQPLTAAFLRAKKLADGLRPASAKTKLTREQLTDYRNAVTDFEVAFDVAERDARRIRDSSFTDVERKRLDTAKQLLTVAIDQAATPAERQLAYRRVRQELDGLISLSDGAIEVLEEKVALELTTGAHPQVPDAATPRVSTTPPPATGTAGGTGARNTVAPSPWPVPARSTDTAPGRVIKPKH